MENNIEIIVKIINQIGNSEIKFDVDINGFVLQKNIELNSSKNQLDSLIFELNELIIHQVDLNIDAKLFQELITLVNSLIHKLKSDYNDIRVFYDFDNIPNQVITILKIIDYKISKLFDLKSKLEFNEKFSDYLGQNQQLQGIVSEEKSSKYKVGTRFELLNKLGITKIITSLNCTQKDKHKILSIIMDIHTDTAKGLINDSYKWIGSDDEQKIINDILKNIR
jgi:hypothetical protein